MNEINQKIKSVRTARPQVSQFRLPSFFGLEVFVKNCVVSSSHKTGFGKLEKHHQQKTIIVNLFYLQPFSTMKHSFFVSVTMLALTLLIGGNAVSLRSGKTNDSGKKEEDGVNSVFFKVRINLTLLLVASFFCHVSSSLHVISSSG
jgi:hypothetical protein